MNEIDIVGALQVYFISHTFFFQLGTSEGRDSMKRGENKILRDGNGLAYQHLKALERIRSQ